MNVMLQSTSFVRLTPFYKSLLQPLDNENQVEKILVLQR